MSKEDRVKEVTGAIQQLRTIIDSTFAQGRERSLAQTKLDECGLWLSLATANGLFADTDKEAEG